MTSQKLFTNVVSKILPDNIHAAGSKIGIVASGPISETNRTGSQQFDRNKRLKPGTVVLTDYSVLRDKGVVLFVLELRKGYCNFCHVRFRTSTSEKLQQLQGSNSHNFNSRV
ncbi:hypothetical protein WN51_00763 [Melipona quadrifasciata]|uniref:Uncharacterized protein n=1 Tax=Melipona quadrifasciata TaxID=166423 RepID=A0A0M8ZZJ7_9HYME|nr:hypothetical protein WN51_00763 [Melipona quadrifasciata]